MGRIRLLSFIILGLALLFIVRLYFLQVVNNNVYQDKANHQYSEQVSGIFDRGTIYFTSKEGDLVSAATLKTGYTVAINPQIIKDPEVVFQKLSGVIPQLDRDIFIAKAIKKNDPYEEIAKQVDESVGQQISGWSIPGVSVYQNRWRFYPAGDVAANTIGFMGFQGDTYAGRYGLERQYQTTLTRENRAYTNFFAEIFSNIKQTVADENEGDVVTTIEPSVQSFLQEELAAVNKKYNSEYTGGIIMNPKTGEIYALGVEPTFDLNSTRTVKDVSTFSNPLVENIYEMGSIIKPLTVAAGIDLGVITASSTYNDTGFLYSDGKKISNFDGKARGKVTIQTALSQSLNVGMAHIVSLIGNDALTNYMYAFGLNQKTGVDLPNEAANLVGNLKSTRDLEHFTASFGQGIALTPMTTVRALSTIANGGVLITPHIVKSVNYKIGLSKELSYPAQARVIKQTTAQEVTRMMVSNVDVSLRNGTVKFPNYSVAAKTGTAQIALPNGGGYSPDQLLHSFVGFFPAYDPQFFIFFYTYKPQGVQYSSESLTDPFIETVKFLINYYNVTPDR